MRSEHVNIKSGLCQILWGRGNGISGQVTILQDDGGFCSKGIKESKWPRSPLASTKRFKGKNQQKPGRNLSAEKGSIAEKRGENTWNTLKFQTKVWRTIQN